MKRTVPICLMMFIVGIVSAEFLQPDTVDAWNGAIYSGASGGTKDGPEEFSGRPASRMINGSGMPENYDETTILSSTYFDTAWLSASSKTSGTVLFSFNTVVDIDSFVLWNNASTSDYSSRGVKDFKIRFFDAAQNLIGSEYSSTAAMAPVSGLNVAPDNFTFSSVYQNVKYVEWEILNNYGGSYVGAQEIGFTSIPEPASAGMIAVVGLILGAYRRIFGRE